MLKEAGNCPQVCVLSLLDRSCETPQSLLPKTVTRVSRPAETMKLLQLLLPSHCWLHFNSADKLKDVLE